MTVQRKSDARDLKTPLHQTSLMDRRSSKLPNPLIGFVSDRRLPDLVHGHRLRTGIQSHSKRN
jgi:hypothetical protein